MTLYRKDRLLPALPNSGFRMEGYYVWCGSVIRGEDGRYYLFAARWPEETGFPIGYMTDSEIVLASTDDLCKPFQFEKVLFGKRPGDYWDSGMAHNPFICRIGDEYVLFYIGTTDGSWEKRAIGYAHSKSLTEGWIRSDKPIALPPDANNPAALVTEEGIWLYFRNGELKVSVAFAKHYDGPYRVLAEDICPEGAVEDMFVFRNGDRFEMIAEDCFGTYTGLEKGGVHFLSKDLIHWKPAPNPQAFDFCVSYTDGTEQVLQRRERPFLFFDGEDVYLFSTAKTGGETKLTGGKTWNMVQKLAR